MRAHSKFQDSEYVRTQALLGYVERKDVLLLKGSVLARLMAEGKLQDKRRQDLEEEYAEAIADWATVKRCMREAEVCALERKDNVHGVDLDAAGAIAYPGVVVVSYCWMTRKHPDPKGSLCKKIARLLHWYAAQRARYTQELLYMEGKRHDPHNCVEGTVFDWEFVVFMDFWSLHQDQRSAVECEAFGKAQRGMHLWFAHRGTMAFLLRAEPEDWSESPEFVERGGYDRRGWTYLEWMVSGLCKAPGMCLHLERGAFEQMLESGMVRWEGAFEAYGARGEQLTGWFEEATADELRALSMWQDDWSPTAMEESCLHGLVARRQAPPMASEQMAAELSSRSFGCAEDRGLCASLYAVALREVIGEQTALSFPRTQHWGAEEWTRFGAAMREGRGVEELDLSDSFTSGDGIRAFAAALADGSLPRLKRLLVYEHGDVDEEAWAAVRRAMGRGALPMLATIMVVPSRTEAWVAALAGVSGLRVTGEAGFVEIERVDAQGRPLTPPSPRSPCCCLC